MTKKNDKRLCWNCDGSVSLHLVQCPYCGVDLTRSIEQGEEGSGAFQGFASPFQSLSGDVSIPAPPFTGALNPNAPVNEDEWDRSLSEDSDESANEPEDLPLSTRREMIALLLLLPGVVFFLFGLALLLFSNEGVLTLEWSESFAYFYFLGALPLLFLGWRALR